MGRDATHVTGKSCTSVNCFITDCVSRLYNSTDPSTLPRVSSVPSAEREMAEIGTGEHCMWYCWLNDNFCGVCVGTAPGDEDDVGGPPAPPGGATLFNGTNVLHLVKYAAPLFPLATIN